MNEMELGLLGDPEQLRRLLAAAQLQPEDRSQANAQALLAFGATLMGAKKGRELEAFGSGLMGGLAARNNALQDAQTTRGRSLAQAAGAQEMMSRGLTMKQQAAQLSAPSGCKRCAAASLAGLWRALRRREVVMYPPTARARQRAGKTGR